MAMSISAVLGIPQIGRFYKTDSDFMAKLACLNLTNVVIRIIICRYLASSN